MFSYLVKISNPGALLAGFLLYGLGVAIAKYLSVEINSSAYVFGQICVTMLQLSRYYLKATYDLPAERDPRAALGAGSEETSLTRTKLLLLSFTTLTIGAVFTVLLFTYHWVNWPVFIIIAASFLLMFLYAVPPFRLVYSGYGELISAFFMANLVPGIGFLLQAGDFHRLLAMITFPITALYLALELAFSLEHYQALAKGSARSMMERFGWQTGMFFHNVMILFGYLLIGVAALSGMPLSLVIPGLVSLPLGFFQIWQISQIGGGAKPHWRLLRLTAAATVGLTAYLFAFSLWTH